MNREGDTLKLIQPDRYLVTTPWTRAGALGLLLVSLCGVVTAQGNSGVGHGAYNAASARRQFVKGFERS